MARLQTAKQKGHEMKSYSRAKDRSGSWGGGGEVTARELQQSTCASLGPIAAFLLLHPVCMCPCWPVPFTPLPPVLPVSRSHLFGSFQLFLLPAVLLLYDRLSSVVAVGTRPGWLFCLSSFCLTKNQEAITDRRYGFLVPQAALQAHAHYVWVAFQ